ncbi:MAG: aldolase, partial [Myxococcota bacterium]
MAPPLKLFLFNTDPDEGRASLAAGIDGFVVDWEYADKERRQDGFDTEINRDTPDDLARMANLGAPRLFCRINRSGPHLDQEVEQAVENGATDILLPMVKDAEEVDRFCQVVDGRARPGILV